MSKALSPPPNYRTHAVEYQTWYRMHYRCYNTRSDQYASYGGRGISVARKWHGPKGFRAFMRDLGPRPSAAHSLDRINVNRGYTPNNCRWALAGVQARNKRSTRYVTLNGETKCFKDWATSYGVHDSVVHMRIDVLGWDVMRAFTTPAQAVGQARGSDPTRKALSSATQRCHNPKATKYATYGGRGIEVTPEWRGRGALARFTAAVGPHPGAGYTLERIDVNKGYEPGNCRWATPKEQADNRRTTRWLTHAGETKTLVDWSRSSGVPVTTISARIRRGWPLARVFALTDLQRARRVCESAACSLADTPVD